MLPETETNRDNIVPNRLDITTGLTDAESVGLGGRRYHKLLYTSKFSNLDELYSWFCFSFDSRNKAVGERGHQ